MRNSEPAFGAVRRPRLLARLNGAAVANAVSARVASNNHYAADRFSLVVALGEMEISVQKQDNLVHRYLLTGKRLWWDEWEKERNDYNHWASEASNLASERSEHLTSRFHSRFKGGVTEGNFGSSAQRYCCG